MGRPDKGRKRTWRFRLDGTTTLEVSAANGPTEKQIRRRGRWSLVLGMLMAALMLVAVAAADNFDADADAFATMTPAGNGATANQQPGTTVEYDLSAAIRNTGNATNDVFKTSGDTVGVTIARSGDWLATPAGSPTSFSFTTYDTNQAGKIGIAVPCGTAAGTSRVMQAVLTAIASNGQTLSGSPVALTWAITAQGADAASCTPANTAPTVDAGGPYSGGEGSDIGLSGGTASDPDGPGPLSYLWEIDTSSVGTGSCALANATSLTLATIECTDNGTATVKLTATEAGPGLSGSDTASVTIDNVAPTAEGLSASSPIDEGSSSSLTLTNPTDASSVDAASLRYSFACDGLDASLAANYAAASTTNAASCPFADNGSFTVKSRVYDKDGAATTYSATVMVDNVPPTVVAGFTSVSVNCQTTATLTVNPDDLGVNDGPWKVNINWGDGNTEPEISRTNLDSFTVTHVYALAGPYNATVSVTDKDDGTGSDLVNAITINQTYTVDFRPPFDDSTPSGLIVNKMKNGRVVPVKATIYDDCGQAYVTDPGADVTIKVSKTSGTGSGDPVEEYADAGESSAGTSGFRWTDDSSAPGGGFWIYNLDSKALGLVVNNLYRVDLYVGTLKATASNWAVLSPVK